MNFFLKIVDSLIPLSTGIMLLLFYFRKIPIRKDPAEDDAAYKKFSKFLLICSIVLFMYVLLNIIGI
jgi:hypothetical protein